MDETIRQSEDRGWDTAKTLADLMNRFKAEFYKLVQESLPGNK